MNYLAHVYLADNSEENMLGNFLGDFVNKSLENEFEYSIRQGIFMHKKLDTFTDSHPDFLNSRKRISKTNRRLAGVLIDIFYDHFLAKNWYEYSSISLEEYSENFYNILKKFSYCLPDKLIKRMPFIIEENWLVSYRNISGIEITVERIAKRFSNTKHPLVNPIDELINNYESLENDFKCFYPHAIEYANEVKRML
ncbi:ACP phosphodiesterase [Clostridium saccharobutylicum]|uniref:Acyl carrier protein phosphodiesterase AcpH n=1 Tax=Clostridium saccharobutylicum DSM 13864 TaxID=1345695 RepID=U5MX71_CLOSA|nr:ACP phosphodiesterase [Clostridium saccharobutylicum]AGX44231.1 acyl carrier protein phosphodiesterase AcpH [Clostridium saccharobutylicum DSM 13864]AQR91520.1 acyl carrier protein phosphodiesterase [Clostridium saccharobutylicum]AQS01425.1 acyl carrier protein phosphodiesterase [Clostridium saccharobutylicum]AQS11034.1 acyl carrier protein phosphodiesterase [Clostridium saccharobutylicum]AQS15408.1 acyl carrier protein phosphodiesterase [Clostridium saccharobutylicum]